jgi:flagellar protein FlaG
MVFDECFHDIGLISSDGLYPAKVVPNFVKIFDLPSPVRLSVPLHWMPQGHIRLIFPHSRRCYAEKMTQPAAPKIQLNCTPDYREGYANSVQVRVNLWDFLLLFGRVNQTAPDNVTIQNFQGIYVSPQQAKALLNVLQQNVNQYESAFGEIRLEPQGSGGIVQ